MQLEIPGNSQKLNGDLVDADIQNGGVFLNLKPEKCSAEPSVCVEPVKNNGTDIVKPSVAFLLKKVLTQVIDFLVKFILSSVLTY